MARNPKTNAISAFVVETDLARRRGDAPLPVHGPAGARERRHPVHRREDPGGEPHRQGGARPQDRAHHPQHRPPLDPGGGGGRRQGLPRDLPQVVGGARRSGARRSASTRRSRTSSPRWRRPCTRWRRSRTSRRRSPTEGLRHPPRGGDGEGVEHRQGVADRRRDDADPRRARVRDGDLARGARRGADRRRAGDARPAHQPDLRGLVRDHAPLHGARGGRQAPPGRGRAHRPEGARSARSSRPCRRSAAFYATWYPASGRAACSRRATASSARSRRTCASSSAPRASSRARSSTRWWCSAAAPSGSRRSCSGSSTSRTSCSRCRRRVSRAEALRTRGAPRGGRRRRGSRDHFCLANRRKVRGALPARSGGTTTRHAYRLGPRGARRRARLARAGRHRHSASPSRISGRGCRSGRRSQPLRPSGRRPGWA